MSSVDIECAIARWWPDIGTIMVRTGATRRQVDDTIGQLNRINDATRREHDCATHPSGSETCYLEHQCRCPECKTATMTLAARRLAQLDTHPEDDLEMAQLRQMNSAYRRGNRDPLIIEGHRKYHRIREAARRGRLREVERMGRAS